MRGWIRLAAGIVLAGTTATTAAPEKSGLINAELRATLDRAHVWQPRRYWPSVANRSGASEHVALVFGMADNLQLCDEPAQAFSAKFPDKPEHRCEAVE